MTGLRSEVERAGDAARVRSGPPQLQQLLDARLRLLLGAPPARVGDMPRIGSAVDTQNLSHALTRHPEARGDLVEASSVPAQQRHLCGALQRSGDRRSVAAAGVQALDLPCSR